MESQAQIKRMTASNIQNQLMNDINIIDQPTENFNYVRSTIGGAIFLHTYKKTEEERKKYHDWFHQRYLCPVCSTEIYRGNKSSHNRTKKHLLYKKVSDKIAKALIGD